tara:strand:- start:753 stop:1676 length:924 start_codon:yes stop_codon:yes gene_type:complete
LTTYLPAVSIGIPFYNAGDDLRNAIKSVFAQTHQNWELILIDDGSKDHSLEIARSIDDPRVRVFSDGQNRRLASRLNEIVRLAKYDFIVRMDADDLIAPDRIARQLQLLVEKPNIDVVSCGVYSLDNSNRVVGRRCVSDNHKITTAGLLNGSCGIVNGALVARKAWFRRNPYDETLFKSEDANLWLRSYARNDLNVVIMPDPLYFYREDNNISEDKILRAYAETRRSIRKDAYPRFRLSERIFIYLKSLMKSQIVWFLARTGGLDMLRRRRIAQPIDTVEQANISATIQKILDFNLPVKEPTSRLQT